PAPISTLFPYTTLFRSCLHQSLLNRVTDRRSRSNIWHRTHSSLVGEHTALHTVHDRSTDRTTADCLEVKSTCKQLADHARQLLGVSQNDNQTKYQVDQRHQWHQILSDRGHPSHATDHNEGGECCQDSPYHNRQPRQSFRISIDSNRSINGI